MSWTIAYRRRTASRFVRVTNWSGTWAQAKAAADLFAQANPEMDVYYVSSREAELAGNVAVEDIANILTETGRRVRIVERDELAAEIIARIPAAEDADARWQAGEPIADPAPAADAEDEQQAHAEALALTASITIDGRPAPVTELLNEAELVTDARENLRIVRRAVELDRQLRAETC